MTGQTAKRRKNTFLNFYRTLTPGLRLEKFHSCGLSSWPSFFNPIFSFKRCSASH